MLGVIPTSHALQTARERGLDLIEVAPNAKPPTCKIMDYGKYKYEQKKRASESKKKQTVINIKEIQIRTRTDQHDLEVKLKHARRFLENGDKTRVNLRFRGREMAHQEIGIKAIKGVIEQLKDIAIVEVPPKMEGRQLFALLAPDPAKLKEIQKAKAQAEKEAGNEEDSGGSSAEVKEPQMAAKSD
jgi:translation initiation factor IF-3